MDCVTTLSRASIPVLKEKPAASSPSAFRQMANLPIKIGVAFQKRFEPRFVQFKKLLPLVGDIASFRAVLAMNIENLDSTWRASDGVGVTVRALFLTRST
jgi:predicted dehydrogenase